MTRDDERLALLASRWSDALSVELPDARSLRRELHAAARLSGDEHATRARLADALEGHLDLDPIADAGAVGRIGPCEGPSIGIRAELDALPVTEATGAPFSASGRVMHACGHDVHQAALVALLRAARGLDLPRGVVALLQPREETYPSGALDMVGAGVISRHEMAHVIAAHVHPGVPPGHVASAGGFINAAADEIDIAIIGRGGHAAYPHEAADTIAATAHIAIGLADVVRRTVSPIRPAIVSVGTMRAGDGAANVLPGTALLRATMRTTDPTDRRELFEAVRRFAERSAESSGARAEVTLTQGEPPLVNDAELATESERWLRHLGVEGAAPMRSLGADDFSYFSDAVPSLMLFVGVATPGRDPQPSLHDPRFLPGDDAVDLVARALLAGYLGAASVMLRASPV